MTFTEALDYVRGILGPNYYISPSLRQNPDKTPQYNIQKDRQSNSLRPLLIYDRSIQKAKPQKRSSNARKCQAQGKISKNEKQRSY